jgi:hypothetical protein
MTAAIAIPDSTTIPTATLPITGVAGADGTATDTSACREMRIEAIHHLLTTAWPSRVEQPDPDALRTIAAALVDSGTPIPAVPTVRAAGHVLAEALTATRAAHARAVADHTAADHAWYDFRDDVRRRAARAVDAGHICLDGTNAALCEFDIDELRQEYRVELNVTVYVTVSASDADDAYDKAEDEVRNGLYGDDVDIDTDDIGHVSAEATGDLDLDD